MSVNSLRPRPLYASNLFKHEILNTKKLILYNLHKEFHHVKKRVSNDEQNIV